MNLKNLLYKVAIESVQGTTNLDIQEINFDSRKVGTNNLFVAIKGTISDGHLFIDKAIGLGAVAVVCQDLPLVLNDGITYVCVKDSNEALAYLATNFYDNPSQKLKLVGITGTNGKTTIASLLYQLYQAAGFKTGLLSTVKIMIDTHTEQATHTTPDSLTINKYLAQMVEADVTYCFMEVSSHGIHQKRSHGLQFAGGVFSNLSHDHLDYHENFAAYRDVKKSFFDNLPKTAFCLSNIDDKNGLVMQQNTKAKKCTYALKSYADYKAQILENQLSGLLLKVNDHEVWVKLIGTFNAYNLLAIYGTAVELGMDKLEALRLLSDLESVSGRFQYFVSNTGITVIIDYAHTPDALQNVISTVNDIRTKNEQLITVVGCGGNRDKEKRPVMGQIASELSDKILFTADNPRDENPETIIDEMEKGVAAIHFKKTISITNRLQAIKTAIQLANPKDIILIAGKGHENYQEIHGVKHHFDDLETAKKILFELQK
jgi:UDP-N-acetylmuramoyl-L-alanyl-D-glutamate--2,6-diaminopimelate ligase